MVPRGQMGSRVCQESMATQALGDLQDLQVPRGSLAKESPSLVPKVPKVCRDHQANPASLELMDGLGVMA